MAEQDDLISGYVDRSGFAGDTDFIKAQLEEVNAMYDKLNSKKISITTASTSRDTIAAVKEAKAANDELIKSKDKLLTIDLKAARAAKETAQAKAAEARAAKDNAKAAETEAKATVAMTREKERLAKAQDKEVAKNANLQSQYKYLSQLHRNAVEESQHLGAALIRQANGNEQVEKQLLATNPLYLEATARAQNYDRQLKLLDDTVGKHQRHVGDYARGFNGLSNSINQITRELPSFTYSVQTGFLAISNNLPIFFDQMKIANDQLKQMRAEGKQTSSLLATLGKAFFSWGTLLSIGITLLTVYGKEIGNFFSSLFKGKDALDAFIERQKSINEAFKEGAVKDAAIALEKVGAAFQLAKDGTITNTEALKVYNENLGEAFGKATSLTDAEKKYAANSDNFIKATLYRAAAMKALEKASDAALKAVEQQLRKPQEFQKFTDEFNAGADVYRTPEDVKDYNDFIAREQKKRQDAAIAEQKKNQKVQEDIANELLKTANQYAEKLPKFDLFGGDKDKNKGKKKVQEDLSALFEIYKRDIELQIAQQQKIVDAEEFSLKARTAARVKIYALQRQLIAGQQEYEIKKVEEKRDAELKEEGYTAEQIKLIRQNANNDIKNIQDDAIKQEEAAQQGKLSDILEMYGKFKEKQADLLVQDIALAKDLPKKTTIEDELARDEKALERRQNLIKEDRYIHLTALERERQAKLNAAKSDVERQKIEEEYNRKRVRIELEADKEIIEATLAVAQAKLKLVDDPLLRSQLEAKIAELKEQLQEFGGKIAKLNIEVDTSDAQEKFKDLERSLQKVAEGFAVVSNTIGGLINANIERQKNALQDQIDLIEERKQKEIETENASADSAQQKADKIAVINQRAAAQKEAIERKQRQLEVERARFEKFANIGRIAIETALAVVHQLATGDPYTATARAIAAGAIGAAQLAVAIATPLPHYGEGTDDHPGGPAELAEKGKREFVVLPDGGMFATGTKSEVHDLPEHTKVFKDDQAFLAYLMKNAISSMPKDKINEENYGVAMTRVLEKKLDTVNETIKNKKELHMKGSFNSATLYYKWAEHWVEHIKDQTDWR
jgi:hypothetical protein